MFPIAPLITLPYASIPILGILAVCIAFLVSTLILGGRDDKRIAKMASAVGLAVFAGLSLLGMIFIRFGEVQPALILPYGAIPAMVILAIGFMAVVTIPVNHFIDDMHVGVVATMSIILTAFVFGASFIRFA